VIASQDHTQRFVHLDVSWMAPASLCAVDALARLQLVARERGCSLELHGADGHLVMLLELVGLADVLQVCPSCGAMPLGSSTPDRGEREDGEPRRVEEGVNDFDAPIAEIQDVEGRRCGSFTGCQRSRGPNAE
jgi:STAS domain